jgi:hypothetical protein
MSLIAKWLIRLNDRSKAQIESLPLRHSLIEWDLAAPTAPCPAVDLPQLEHKWSTTGFGELPHCGYRIGRCGLNVVILGRGNGAVAKNQLDHGIVNAKAIQIGCQASPKPMPTVPEDTCSPKHIFHFALVASVQVKRMLEVLTRYFAVALAGQGITVNTISPGWIEDTVLNSLPSAVQDEIRNWHKGGWTPMGRLGTPADVGNAVALLCSDEANWITGQQLIDVDGGASLMDAHLPQENDSAGKDGASLR